MAEKIPEFINNWARTSGTLPGAAPARCGYRRMVVSMKTSNNPQLSGFMATGIAPLGRSERVFSARCRAPYGLAERVGFEPTLEFPLNTLSKRAPSTTRPPLLKSGCPFEFNIWDALSPADDGRPSVGQTSMEEFVVHIAHHRSGTRGAGSDTRRSRRMASQAAPLPERQSLCPERGPLESEGISSSASLSPLRLAADLLDSGCSVGWCSPGGNGSAARPASDSLWVPSEHQACVLPLRAGFELSPDSFAVHLRRRKLCGK
jgi:hypothetical protein